MSDHCPGSDDDEVMMILIDLMDMMTMMTLLMDDFSCPWQSWRTRVGRRTRRSARGTTRGRASSSTWSFRSWYGISETSIIIIIVLVCLK
jgi:hypothetical protein